MKNLFIITFLLCSSHLNAQFNPDWGYTAAELNFASKGSEFLPNASINNFTNRQFKIGFSFRLNTFYSGAREYITAPAMLTSGMKGPGVLFADQMEENMDTIVFKKSQTYSLNVALLMELGISNSFAAGFNIDLGGISYAPKQEGTFKDEHQQNVISKSGLLNLRLIGDNNIGNLNSELYLKYNVSNSYYVKGGASLYFNEYQTLEDYRFENNRFRTKNLAPTVGIGYRLNYTFF